MPDSRRLDELFAIGDQVREALAATHEAREKGLVSCRAAIRASSRAIRAVHRLEPEEAARLAGEAKAQLRQAQSDLRPHPLLAGVGFLHDAEKEYAEACLTIALVDGSPLRSADELAVGVPAWLNGLAEAASELRRHLLDRLRAGELERAEELLGAMDDVYELVITIDYPDAITGGLRRTTDALRAVLERSRGDVTNATLQVRLQRELESGKAEL